jgi:DNA-binding NtrC family response regulator
MKATILVVDDEVEVRELLNQILTRAGYQVHQVKDGATLKEAFERIQPDVVLLDYKLPDATGLDLLPLIKKEWPESEVIMLTGHATYDVAVEATKRGAFHFQENSTVRRRANAIRVYNTAAEATATFPERF